MKMWRATVTLSDGKVVKVKYPADHPVPNQAAVEAAAKAKGVKGFSQAPLLIEHHRDGEPLEVDVVEDDVEDEAEDALK